MSDILERLSQTLKTNGYSLTWPRKLVFGALQHEEPQTMSELVAHCSNIDRASVYRTVGLFEELGIVQRVHIGWKYKLELSDAFHEHHHHLHCSRCGKTIPLPEDKRFEAQLKTTAKKHGFTLQSHQLELAGLCNDCQKL